MMMWQVMSGEEKSKTGGWLIVVSGEWAALRDKAANV